MLRLISKSLARPSSGPEVVNSKSASHRPSKIIGRPHSEDDGYQNRREQEQSILSNDSVSMWSIFAQLLGRVEHEVDGSRDLDRCVKDEA